jgi:hypothetical protein
VWCGFPAVLSIHNHPAPKKFYNIPQNIDLTEAKLWEGNVSLEDNNQWEGFIVNSDLEDFTMKPSHWLLSSRETLTSQSFASVRSIFCEYTYQPNRRKIIAAFVAHVSQRRSQNGKSWFDSRTGPHFLLYNFFLYLIIIFMLEFIAS